MARSVPVETYGSAIAAEWAKNLLQANGIHAAVMADDAGGQLFPLSNEVRLMVMEDDLETASQILENYSSQEQEEAAREELMTEGADEDADYAELPEDNEPKK